MRVFGAKCFAHVAKELRKKWEPKSKRMVLVGYAKTAKNFRLWDEASGRVAEYRDVVFDPATEIIPQAMADELEATDDSDAGRNDGQQDGQDDDQGEGQFDGHGQEHHEEPKVGRPKGAKNKVYEKVARTLRSSQQVLIAAAEPQNYGDALASEDSREWTLAMNDEINSLAKNKTWLLMELPKGQKAIQSRWVFRVKERPDGSVARYKARLVAKGFTQRPGIDFTETFAPVVRMDSVRTILALATEYNMEMVHFDIKTAFLYGDIDEELYMAQPEGHEDGTGRVCKLLKGLYGLKQSPRAWNKKLHDFLQQFGLTHTHADPCVYVAIDGQTVTLLGLYVDDGLLCSTELAKVNGILTSLKATFEISVEDTNCFLGLQIDRNREAGTLKIHQASYVRKILERFNMAECRAIATPSDVALKLKKSEVAEQLDVPYMEAVGSLMYAMTGTRPDIAYAVGKVAQFMANPGPNHWTAAKHIFRYLRGTAERGITYRASGQALAGYSDSDYAGDLDRRRSTSGYVFLLAGGAVAWSSRIQQIQAMSTCEAEYVAAAEAVKQSLWMRQLLKELGQNQDLATTIYCDNQGAIRLVANPELNTRTKHIDVRHHFIRDAQADGKVHLEYVPTNEQAADVFTKALHGPTFGHCLELIGQDI